MTEKIAISKFKATCLSRLETVRRTGQPLLVTKHGVPIAQVLPPPAPEPPATGFGCMRDTVEVLSDIVSPADPGEWDAAR
ncbi:MAG: type II toxin-antitoxin system prevent-host-death family antitoxin [Acidobacteriota bacterium]